MSTAIKTNAKGLLDDTSVSTLAVYRPRSAKQKHLWRSCTSPARCNCISTAIKIESESTSGRHSHVGQGGINRDQQRKNVSGANVYHQRGISTPISKAKAYLCCILTAIKRYGERTSERHNRVDLVGIPTAIIKTKAYSAQLYITSAIYLYINSHQK